MRIYTTAIDGDVDLDDIKTYEHLPNTIHELQRQLFVHIGYSYWYMNFLHKDVFKKQKQKKRVNLLIQQFTDNREINRTNLLWFQEMLFLFEDEIENMC